MIHFINHFLICNIYIVLFIGILFALKGLLKKHVSARLHYNLWFIMLIFLLLPFIPSQTTAWIRMLWNLISLNFSSVFISDTESQTETINPENTSLNWMNDFSISVTKSQPSLFRYIFLTIWIVGVLAMIIFTLKSILRLHHIEQSSPPVQNKNVLNLFETCKSEMAIKRNIRIYHTVYLKSPIMTGIFTPRIYIPAHLISDFNAKDMHYMLLHELQHYKHLDSFVNYLMNLATIIYWFNPFVWYAIKEMKSDREIACDSSVLEMLNEEDYADYGNTLINFAEKISFFPFVSTMGGNIKQIKKRIINIVNYQPLSLWEKIKGVLIYCLIAVLFLGLSPLFSTNAAETEYYTLNETGKKITYIDLDPFFLNYRGCFVLYNTVEDTWQIYNKNYAAMRVSPDSTYKIYDALIGLESGIITPEHSEMNWNGEKYPFDTWNKDQDLNSAMQNSVNWYFQNIDRQAGIATIKKYIQKIGYGNQDISRDFPSYWIESSLKISAIEQVELLRKFYYNEFHFSRQNINEVKDSLRIYSSGNSTIYGKTGTGKVNGHEVNGWFIGFIEKSHNVYFFATNIQGNYNTTGSKATEISQSIFTGLDILK